MPNTKDLRHEDIFINIKDIDRTRSTVKFSADKGSFSRATRRLQTYKALPNKLRPVLEDLATYVRGEMIPRTFKSEGPGWAKLAPRTQRERIMAGFPGDHPILYRTGDLLAELTQKTHPKHIEIIKVGKEARIEIGGSSKKFIDNQRGLNAQRLPARPMIPGTGDVPVDPRDRIQMREILRKGIARSMGV